MFNWRSLLQWPFAWKFMLNVERQHVQTLCKDNHDLQERITSLSGDNVMLIDRLSALEEQCDRLKCKLNDAINSNVELTNKLTVATNQAKSLRTAKAVWDVLTTLDNTLEAHLESALKVVRDSKSRIGEAYELSPDPATPSRIPRPSNS